MNIYSEPIAITGDEGFELTKLQTLLSKSDIQLFWNDQPWLYHQILSLIAGDDQNSAVVLRAFSTLCSVAIALLGAKYASGKLRLPAVILFGAIFLFSPWTFTLSVAAMTEIPAWALALSALAFQRFNSSRLGRATVVITAALFSASLHFKFSTVLILPCILTEIFISCRQGQIFQNQSRVKAVRSIGLFCITSVVVFGLLIYVAPNFNFSWILGTHVDSLRSEYSLASQARSLSLGAISTFFWMFCGALLCIMLGFEKGIPRRSFSPIVLLITVLIVHSLVRPWWYYYSLHWAIACGLVITSILTGDNESPEYHQQRGTPTSSYTDLFKKPSTRYIATVIGVACCLSAHIVDGFDTLENQYFNILNRDRVSTSPLLASIIKYNHKSRWMYTSQRDYSFYSGVRIPPEIRWLSIKRFISGQISSPKVLNIVASYHPEQLLLTSKEADALNWSNIVTNYDVVLRTSSSVHFVLKGTSKNPGF